MCPTALNGVCCRWEMFARSLDRKEVLPDGVAQGPVHAAPVALAVERGESGEVSPGVVVELLLRPGSRFCGYRIEELGGDLAVHGGVVVAEHGNRTFGSEASDDAVRIWPITDRIAQVPNCFRALRLGIRENGVERHQVRVHVRDEGDSHRPVA